MKATLLALLLGLSLSPARASEAGGDGAGNGGDELRRVFIALGQNILTALPDQALATRLRPTLDVRRIEVASMLPGGAASAVNGREILLDKETWDEKTGILAGGVDPRLEMLRLMHLAAGISANPDALLSLYSSLPRFAVPLTGAPAHVAPWCPVEVAEVGPTAIPSPRFEGRNRTEAVARRQAMGQCQARYVECRVVENTQGGFGTLTYRVVVQGVRYEQHRRTSSQIRRGRCELLQRCGTLYELAPMGQIAPALFQELERRIQADCH